jgi:hypothetical protein
MKARWLLLLAPLALLGEARAADPRLAAIKKEYLDVAAGIRSKAIVSRQTRRSEVVPGIGDQTHTFRFWSRKDGALAKVEVTYNVAADDRYRSEYLFSSGKLVFWLDRSMDFAECNGSHHHVKHEARVYWADDKPIHVLTTRSFADGKEPEGCRKVLRLGAVVEPIGAAQLRLAARGEALARIARQLHERLAQNAPKRELDALMAKYKK